MHFWIAVLHCHIAVHGLHSPLLLIMAEWGHFMSTVGNITPQVSSFCCQSNKLQHWFDPELSFTMVKLEEPFSLKGFLTNCKYYFYQLKDEFSILLSRNS